MSSEYGAIVFVNSQAPAALLYDFLWPKRALYRRAWRPRYQVSDTVAIGPSGLGYLDLEFYCEVSRSPRVCQALEVTNILWNNAPLNAMGTKPHNSADVFWDR